MPKPWKIEWAATDAEGEELDWFDDFEDAKRQAEANGGTVVRIKRYADERDVVWPMSEDEDGD